MSETAVQQLKSLPNLQAFKERQSKVKNYHNFGDETDLDRLQDKNDQLYNEVTNNDDAITDLLNKLISEQKIVLVDKDNMIPYSADAVVMLKDGKYALTYPR